MLTSTSVTMYLDGVFRYRKNGFAGVVDNNVPMTVGFLEYVRVAGLVV